MKSLSEMPPAVRAGIRGVFADIDDTLTTEGRLTAEAYGALERFHEAGLLVLLITGRPAGWCDHMARMWPIDGIVGENGAFSFRYLKQDKRLRRRYHLDPETRRQNRARLDALIDPILSAVPGAAVASDQAYREADLAIDFCEDVPPLPREAVHRIVEIFESAGAQAKISSIHVNGWFGDYDKLTMTRTLLAEEFSIDLDAERESFVFLGDSPNDAPFFGHFPNAVGVANLRDFLDELKQTPAYITRARAGSGFVEAADFLLGA
jgi:HAD superfamily hydrolase (TIGR01484 family)